MSNKALNIYYKRPPILLEYSIKISPLNKAKEVILSLIKIHQKFGII